MRTLFLISSCLLFISINLTRADEKPAAAGAASGSSEAVSFSRQIRPILQAHCQGCHQPAKASGNYILTSPAALLRPGESGDQPIMAGHPESSSLLSLITPVNGQAMMPKGQPALSDVEQNLIRRWIEQGAVIDENGRQVDPVDQQHPPVYVRPPVLTTVTYSPDGSLLAVAGFHEVVLLSNETYQPIGRLVGLSERIESVEFSPDGTRLAVAGGLPARQGEVQIWNVASQKLELSIPIGFDTLYGASWSPDGKIVAVGCPDSTVRGIDSTTGTQVFFNGAHDDWPLQTVFSKDGSALVSVGRDMSTKLYNVATQRFIDNVTSITPGALKGGLSALTRHPDRDEIIVGGSDGIPRIYRMERVTKRVIGDDANLIRRYPGLNGRIYSVAYAPDGKSFACVASLDGKGEVGIYPADAPFEMPKEIKQIVEKTVSSQKPEEKQKLEAYVTENTQPLARLSVPAALYSIAYHPSEPHVAIAGSDGRIRIVHSRTGTLEYEFDAVPMQRNSQSADKQLAAITPVLSGPLAGQEKPVDAAALTHMEVQPEKITLRGPYDSVQLIVTGILQTGERIDLTRLVDWKRNGESVVLSPLGRVYAQADGTARLTASWQGHEVAIPVLVTEIAHPGPVSFIRDVNPVLTRIGCNQGTCHGAKDGKAGFKLSLRGYDPVFDVRAFTDDVKSRRTNIAAPDQSLMLLKISGTVPHVGGRLTRPGEAYYEVIRRWIAEGAHLDQNVERVTSIDIEPHNPVVQQIGARQQLRVIATYSNGQQRDVTGEAFLESGNTEVAESNRAAIVTALRRGEAPILARFDGNYAATTLTVMGDRTGFAARPVETWNQIDKLVAQKWERMKIEPSGLCSDEEFLRRVYLDLTGLPPSPEEVIQFAADPRPVQEKRGAIVDTLIGSDASIEFWTNKWADMLQVNSKFLGKEGAAQFRSWIRQNVARNRPYDEFCYDVLTATGSTKTNPAASYYKILREPDAIMENTTHLFLAIRFNCNKCHDHPFERWTQDQYFQTTAFFAQVGLKRDPKNPNGNIGGTAVEGAKPLWEEVFDKPDGEITHDRTGEVTAPLVPFDRNLPTAGQNQTRRQQLARWMTSPENDYFARSYVNRIWGYLMGVGLIEPLDDVRAGNPPSNPELLNWMTDQFVQSGFNVRELMRMICKSRVYQLEIATNRWNEDDHVNYSHALPKRLPAEVLYDSVYTVTGSKMKIPGVPEGTRAAALPDVQISLSDGFLDNLGRPVRESSCECERSSDLQLGPVMALMNGTTVSDAISQPGNALDQLVSQESDLSKIVDQVFLRILNRHARPQEVQATEQLMSELQAEHTRIVTERDAYRQKIAPVMAEREQRRQQAITQAEADLAAFQTELRPRIEQAEAERQKRIETAQNELETYQQENAERTEKWESQQTETPTPWTVPAFPKLTATNKATLKQQPDQSILASGPNGKGTYVLQTQLKLKQIAGFQLEALSDPGLPGKGPGRSAGGNFVVTEFQATAWPVGKPEEKHALKLHNAHADFSQAGYTVASAIDGNLTSGGWAISPQSGKDHYATFEVQEPFQSDEDIVLELKIEQHYTDSTHSLGKFRISVTDQAGPVNLGLPANIVEILAVAAPERSAEQIQTLQKFVNSRDAAYQDLSRKLAEQKKPLPEDPHLIELRDRIATYKQPLPLDPKLVSLERAADLSAVQLKNQRLTTVQDLAWALINSPAFLFNR